MMSMRTKATLVVGFAAGYVLGTKAGRQRYQQISELTRRLASDPRVQNAVDTVKTQASATASQATHAVQEKFGSGSPNGVADPYPYDPVVTAG